MTDWIEAVPGQDLHGELDQIFRDYARSAKRSQQREIGPSEIGTPCDRRLALAIMQEPKISTDSDPLPSVTGTALHTWFCEGALRWHNKQLGRQRWLTERRVTLRGHLTGSCDIYDCDSCTVVDLKNPGVTKLREYRKADHPGEQYHIQIQGYGLGYSNEGFEVRNVAIYALPRGGQLSNSWFWQRPYDPAVALDAIDRMDRVAAGCFDLDVANHPERYQLIPTADSYCEYCPWHSPFDMGDGIAHCTGHPPASD